MTPTVVSRPSKFQCDPSYHQAEIVAAWQPTSCSYYFVMNTDAVCPPPEGQLLVSVSTINPILKYATVHGTEVGIFAMGPHYNYTTNNYGGPTYSTESIVIYGQPKQVNLTLTSMIDVFCNVASNQSNSMQTSSFIELSLNYSMAVLGASGQVRTLETSFPIEYTDYQLTPTQCPNGLSCMLAGTNDMMTITLQFLPNGGAPPPDFDSAIPVRFSLPSVNYTTTWAIVQDTDDVLFSPPNYNNDTAEFLVFVHIPENPNEFHYRITFSGTNGWMETTFNCSAAADYSPAFTFDFEFEFSTTRYTLQVVEMAPTPEQPGQVVSHTGSTDTFNYGIVGQYSLPGDGWNSDYIFSVDVLAAP